MEKSNMDWIAAALVLAAIASFMQYRREPAPEPVYFERRGLRDAPRDVELTPEQAWAFDKKKREKAPPSPNIPGRGPLFRGKDKNH